MALDKRLRELARAGRWRSGPSRNGSRGGAYHWRAYRIENLLPTAESGRNMLLLGCGDGGELPYLRKLGFRIVGLDIQCTAGTDVAADAHRLPFPDAAFDVVLSMQVLEHLHSPWMAVKEVSRVLGPGGWFLGSVAFLKPYHNSYFHMTHQGVRHLLVTAGLEPDWLAGAQSLTYSIYAGMVPLGYRALARTVLGSFDRLLAGLRVKLWSLTRREDPDRPTDRFHEGLPLSFRTFDKLRFAAAIVFRARKSAA